MLSRVADGLYWLGRYMERATHAARVLRVARDLQIDLREVNPELARVQWAGTIDALRIQAENPTGVSMMFDEDEMNSIATCISHARENARQVREIISSEMWEQLNASYWRMQEAKALVRNDDGLDDALANVLTAAFVWSGVCNSTMRRGEGWLFTKLGQFVERADNMAHLIAVRTRSMPMPIPAVDDAHLLWVTLLRSCSALEAYRKVHPARVDPRLVTEFLVLDSFFPQAVLYAVTNASEFVHRLAKDDGRGPLADRAFGKIRARLAYADVDEILQSGTAEFLESVSEGIAEGNFALHRIYFRY